MPARCWRNRPLGAQPESTIPCPSPLQSSPSPLLPSPSPPRHPRSPRSPSRQHRTKRRWVLPPKAGTISPTLCVSERNALVTCSCLLPRSPYRVLTRGVPIPRATSCTPRSLHPWRRPVMARSLTRRSAQRLSPLGSRQPVLTALRRISFGSTPTACICKPMACCTGNRAPCPWPLPL